MGKRISKRTQVARLQLKREARAIIAVAAITKTGKSPHWEAPNYYVIAKSLGLSDKAADLADEFYNQVNGPDEWTVALEEAAMERAQDLIEMQMEDM